MKSLTSRERVACALAHQEPDRVPIDIGGTAASFTDVAYERMKRYLGLESQGDFCRPGENAAYYDDNLLELLGTDYRHVYLHPSTADRDAWNASDGTEFVDEWGVCRRAVVSDFGGVNWERVSYPLADATDADISSYPWPDVGDPARIEGLQERAKHLWDETNFAVATRAVSHGLLEIATELRGMEQFLIDLMINKPFAHRLMSRILEVQIGLHGALLDAVGPYIQVCTTCDDYGSQSGLLISPKLYREMIMPYRLELNQFIKSKAPQAYIELHSCGSVYKLLPDLLETGVEILNPVQPLAKDMDPDRLKTEFGDKFAFRGAIDIQHAMVGSVDSVRREVLLRIAQLGPGGGYVVAACSNFQADVPPENILAMIEAARDGGRYPIAADCVAAYGERRSQNDYERT